MIRSLAFLVAVGFFASGFASARSEESASLLEREPEGWTDLLGGEGLKNWKRVAPGTKFPLAAESPWRLKDGVLRAETEGIYELLLTEQTFSDGVLHVEWRYVGEPEKPDSGILVRANTDGSEWYQAQLATPGLGSISTKGYNRLKVTMRRPDLQRPAGEWNVMEITLKGPDLSLWINGETVAETSECAALEGRFGLQAEFVPIEFRAVRFKRSLRASF